MFTARAMVFWLILSQFLLFTTVGWSMRDLMSGPKDDSIPGVNYNSDSSPYNQEFPDCTKSPNSEPLITKSKLKVLSCPMIRDEEGFLSEWAAYYKVHGFSHVMFFDDGSTDDFMKELKPWIESGFVSVKHNVSIASMRGTRMKTPFMKAMAKKAIYESVCMQQANKWGYDYYLSLDLDEYVLPHEQHLSFVDMIDLWQTKSKRKMFCMMKYNFASVPHIAEPVHLLTIEAYQTRMAGPGKMNHYTSVAKKCMYKLKDPIYSHTTKDFIAECCHFHGCQGEDFTVNTDICRKGWKNATRELYSQDKGGKFSPLGSIYHYSRSLEKFALKKRTWSTAGGEFKSSVGDYSLSYFLHRSAGYTLDHNMLRYACQTRRAWLEIHTNYTQFLRPGESWYRNIEFGKRVNDPEKRGRYGREKTERVRDGNPYLFDGTTPPGKKKKEMNKAVRKKSKALMKNDATTTNGGDIIVKDNGDVVKHMKKKKAKSEGLLLTPKKNKLIKKMMNGKPTAESKVIEEESGIDERDPPPTSE